MECSMKEWSEPNPSYILSYQRHRHYTNKTKHLNFGKTFYQFIWKHWICFSMPGHLEHECQMYYSRLKIIKDFISWQINANYIFVVKDRELLLLFPTMVFYLWIGLRLLEALVIFVWDTQNLPPFSSKSAVDLLLRAAEGCNLALKGLCVAIVTVSAAILPPRLASSLWCPFSIVLCVSLDHPVSYLQCAKKPPGEYINNKKTPHLHEITPWKGTVNILKRYYSDSKFLYTKFITNFIDREYLILKFQKLPPTY